MESHIEEIFEDATASNVVNNPINNLVNNPVINSAINPVQNNFPVFDPLSFY